MQARTGQSKEMQARLEKMRLKSRERKNAQLNGEREGTIYPNDMHGLGDRGDEYVISQVKVWPTPTGPQNTTGWALFA